jgi:hypothetical protein
MKTLQLNRVFFILSVGFLLFTSCKKEDNTSTNDELTAENIQKSAEVDKLSDETTLLMEENFIKEENFTSKSNNSFDRMPPSCLIKTVTIAEMTKTVVLDFGSSCILPNGNEVSGIITLVYQRNPQEQSHSFNFSFDNFYFNGKNIAGSGSIVRQLSNTNGNPQSDIEKNITVTWPNGATAHRVSNKTREWIAGFGSGTWGDNVFLITGNQTTEFPNGNVNSGIITTPLRREMSCNFIVSGVIAITHNNHTGTLDFGDGNCDNQVIFTDINGNEHIISLN